MKLPVGFKPTRKQLSHEHYLGFAMSRGCIVSEQTGVWPNYVIRMPKGLFVGRRRCYCSTRARQILIIKVDHGSPADRSCVICRMWPREARAVCCVTVAQRVDREQGVLWTHGDDGCG